MGKTIGWIGTGVMGKSMCGHILKRNDRVLVYSRTREKAGELEKMGAEWCANPRELASKSDYVFSIVGFPSDVEDVFLGDEGILRGINSGSIIIDMTTSEPLLALRNTTRPLFATAKGMQTPISSNESVS